MQLDVHQPAGLVDLLRERDVRIGRFEVARGVIVAQDDPTTFHLQPNGKYQPKVSHDTGENTTGNLAPTLHLVRPVEI